MERTFELIGCTDAQRILCAQYHLVQDAGRWWMSYWRLRPAAERAALTWEDFKEIVMEQYCPQHYREQMERDFWNLEQERMTVSEYERKFNQMSFFVQHMVDTDRKRALKFHGGLRPGIRHIVASHGTLSYSETVLRAQEIAASQDLDRQQTRNTGKRSWNNDENKKNDLNKQARTDEKSGPSTKPLCTNCGKNHNGECLKGQDACYRCKKPGHGAWECATRNNEKRKEGHGSEGNARFNEERRK